MIYSLSRYVSDPLFVWCLYGELSRKHRDRFSRHLCEQSNVSCVEFINMGWISQSERLFPLKTPHITHESYYRLFAQFYLPENLDRILWLDSDIIVKGSLQELYSTSLKDIPLVAFTDMDQQKDNDWHLRRLGLSLTKPYFNAGVLLLNLDFLRTKTSKSTLLDFCKDKASLIRFEDQDLMNLLYHDCALILNDQRFNCMVKAPKRFSNPNIAENAIIIHYAGREKPWLFQWQNDFSRFWWDVRREEGLGIGDRWTLVFGWLWNKLDGPRWKRLLLKPYLWYADRKALRSPKRLKP